MKKKLMRSLVSLDNENIAVLKGRIKCSQAEGQFDHK